MLLLPPPGYRERTTSEPAITPATAERSEIVPCEKGTYSLWVNGARTPTSPIICQRAGETDRMYAPRVGMQQALACKAGTYPKISTNTVTDTIRGADLCAPCAAGTYRDFFTNTPTCASCPDGRETGPSGRAACTPW